MGSTRSHCGYHVSCCRVANVDLDVSESTANDGCTVGVTAAKLWVLVRGSEALRLLVSKTCERVGIEYLDTVAVFCAGGVDSVAGTLERVWNNGYPTVVTNILDCRRKRSSWSRPSFDTDSEEVTVGGRHLHAGDADETRRFSPRYGTVCGTDPIVIGDHKPIDRSLDRSSYDALDGRL
jgi:hypothetical protein